MCRPSASPWISPAAANSLRWNDSVAFGSASASTISPGVCPSGPASTSSRNTESRVGCPSAARAVVALFNSMFLEYSNNRTGQRHDDDLGPRQPGRGGGGHTRPRKAGPGRGRPPAAHPDPVWLTAAAVLQPQARAGGRATAAPVRRRNPRVPPARAAVAGQRRRRPSTGAAVARVVGVVGGAGVGQPGTPRHVDGGVQEPDRLAAAGAGRCPSDPGPHAGGDAG